MYRLFVAIDLPEWVKQELRRLCFGLRGARWMTEDQMHLTLRFIGEVDGNVFSDAAEALQSVVVTPFELELKGLGFFPPRRSPEIIWVGVKKNDTLLLLRNRVESALVRTGIEPEGRKFSAHVTLARLKDTPIEHVAQYLTQNSLFRLKPFAVSQFHLYSSFLASEGAIHTVEATYELQIGKSM